MSEPNERDKEVYALLLSNRGRVSDLSYYRERCETQAYLRGCREAEEKARDIARLKAPAPAQSREDEALADERETLEHWDEHDVGTMTNALESAIDAYDALRARLASAQSSAQGEEAREIVAARDEEWKAWIKAKGFDLEPLAGCP